VKKSNILPFYKKGHNTDFSKYRGISLWYDIFY